ncbi:DNA-directed RNA polymerase III subunit RPC3 [Ischnura elegans]|uniref:DNA-directed RNA polymerase III subunit RPC3 n=1 Tax=Ischnura elegans TaxID=197161 RepID=UPI001ED88CF5|nr:DNA-directed RNA polymerase III subunit RPC3 [Ischnura elegans]
MSWQFGKLVSSLLFEHYGEAAQVVGDDLFRWGAKPLRELIASTGLPADKIKEALCLLIKFNLVSFAESRVPERPEYIFHSERLLLLLRYPRYLYVIKSLYGNEEELLVEDLLQYGQKTASGTLCSVARKLNEAMEGNKSTVSLQSLRDKFSLLAKNKFIQRCPAVTEGNIPTFSMTEAELYFVPDVDIKKISQQIQESDDKSDNLLDDHVYWRVNFDRFHQEMRDQIMITSIGRRVDDHAAELLGYLFKLMYQKTDPWAPSSNPISLTEIQDVIRKDFGHPSLSKYLNQYIKVLEEDSSKFVDRCGDGGGGQYCVNMKNAFIQLAWVTIENIVVERLGSKAARILRLVKIKKFIEQDQILQLCMIPSKECKLLLYQLSQENFLQLRELRKTLSNTGPNKTFYLYHVDLEQVVRMTLEMCYKALYNALERRRAKKSDNKRLIEKQQRIESIALSLKERGASEDQLAEIEDMLTPPERTVLEKVRVTMNKLTEAELQIDETVFVLQLYLMYKLDKV